MNEMSTLFGSELLQLIQRVQVCNLQNLKSLILVLNKLFLLFKSLGIGSLWGKRHTFRLRTFTETSNHRQVRSRPKETGKSTVEADGHNELEPPKNG